jgi:4-amino-4-deoxy-L-arabinose transferase-like glycosyltransferase
MNWEPGTMNSKLLLIAIIWAGIYLPRLGDPELRGEEPRRVSPGITMLETGNWLVPYVGGEPYLRKPPLINWLVALSVLSTGRADEFAARLPSVLAVLFLALGIYGFSRRWLGEEHALFASIALLTTVSLIDKGRMAEIEAVYIAAFGLGLLLWIHFLDRSIWARWLLPAIPLGLGLLAKGPLHLLFYYGIVILVLWRAQRLKELISPAHILSLLLMIGIFAAWAVPHLQTPEAHEAARTWSTQFSGRLAMSEFHWKDWLINYPRALSNFLPWILFIPFGRGSDGDPKDKSLIFGLEIGTLISFLIVMLAPGSLPRYTMPLLVPTCLLAACRLKRSPQLAKVWRNALYACIFILLLAFVAGFFMPSNRLYLLAGFVITAALLSWRYSSSASATAPTPDRRWRAWNRWAGRSDLRSLTVETGLLVVSLIFFYCAVVMPQQMKREVLRPRAALLAKLVPASETLYALNPGPQPIFFYLRKPWRFITDWNELPADAHYVLISADDLPELTKQFGTGIQRLLTYKDRGEKESSLYAVAGQKKN